MRSYSHVKPSDRLAQGAVLPELGAGQLPSPGLHFRLAETRDREF